MIIENGILFVSNCNGNKIAPTITQIKSNLLSDVKELGIRVSNIGVNFEINAEFNKEISLSLQIRKRDNTYLVPIFDSLFLTYIIINNTIYHINGRIDIINDSLKQLNINPNNFTYGQYVTFSKLLQDNGITISVDNVKEKVEFIKNDETHLLESKGLKATLYPYQVSGFRWLSFMIENGCGCILGDEMGLGKTLQIIATFGRIKEIQKNVSFLVVCPVSLLENWRREIQKFYPSLSTIINYGPNRIRYYSDLLPYDVVIVPYSCLQTDEPLLSMINWDILALDEAQSIKNPSAMRTKNVKLIPAKCKIAISGTPFENHMTDVWSIMDFILPGFLGGLRDFCSTYSDNVESAVDLERVVSPFIIRRLVKDVGNTIPDRIDIPQPIIMTQEEAEYYDQGRRVCKENYGLDVKTLDQIQKLRLFCTHPFVYESSLSSTGMDPTKVSNKYSRFCDIVEEIFLRNEKVVVFTSFRKMIDLIVKDIQQRFHVYVNFIDGSTLQKDRQNIIDEFSAFSGSSMLVLNPIAAGVGLNITSANHVIHYNLEWNPAKEDQASGRVYRTGQTKKVFVHRLFYTNTIEEFINEKIEMKRVISGALIVGNVGDNTSREDLIRVLNVSPLNVL